ncbi:MAG TPA: hypothetical protein H9883_01565 [Candidatus Ruthenibacterium merdigallinarum]|nr:hypothetical protein [Candidatus Ruthenibacterium merdigallinarum]
MQRTSAAAFQPRRFLFASRARFPKGAALRQTAKRRSGIRNQRFCGFVFLWSRAYAPFLFMAFVRRAGKNFFGPNGGRVKRGNFQPGRAKAAVR